MLGCCFHANFKSLWVLSDCYLCVDHAPGSLNLGDILLVQCSWSLVCLLGSDTCIHSLGVHHSLEVHSPESRNQFYKITSLISSFTTVSQISSSISESFDLYCSYKSGLQEFYPIIYMVKDNIDIYEVIWIHNGNSFHPVGTTAPPITEDPPSSGFQFLCNSVASIGVFVSLEFER